MKSVVFRVTIAAVFFLAATACSEGEDADVALPEVPTYEGTIDLEIGELDGDDSYLFSYIQDVAADERGRVIVADRQSLEIRVFGPEGDFAFQFGGPGEGPGEFEDLCCMEFAPDGEPWVREDARYSAFVLHADGAEHQRVVRTPHLGHIGLRGPFSFDMAGDLVSVGPVPRDGGPSLDARFRVGADGVVDTVVMADAERQSTSQATVPFAREVAGGIMARGIAYLHQPFGPQWEHAHTNGGTWAEMITSDYSINLHHPDGTVSVIEGPMLEGPPLTEDNRAWAQNRIDSERDRADIDNHPLRDSGPQTTAGRHLLRLGGPVVGREDATGRSHSARSRCVGWNDAGGTLPVAEPDSEFADVGHRVRAVRGDCRLARGGARGAGAVAPTPPPHPPTR